MPKAKGNVASRARRKRILKLAKGYRLGKSKLLKTAKESVERALSYAYRDRRQKKRNFRRLWITRINAACRLNDITYSNFIHALGEKKIDINRKMLAELAMNEPKSFEALVKKVSK
jgi:large subunit ribosomal protein L20